jgi:hypothetical protein
VPDAQVALVHRSGCAPADGVSVFRAVVDRTITGSMPRCDEYRVLPSAK